MQVPMADPASKKRTPSSFLARFADNAPYFLGVGAGTQHANNWQRAETILGQLLHIALWTVVVVYDTLLLRDDFNNTEQPYYPLMLAAAVTVFVAAACVVLLTLIHIVTSACDVNFNFNDGHLPAFATSTILGGVRSSLLFTLLLLIAFITIGNTAGNEMSATARDRLIAQLVLKQVGISFTANAHRFAVPGGYVKAE